MGITEEADELLERLYPINRSITGDGLRATLEILRGVTPFSVQSVPSGTRCYDWTIPDEWNVREAYIEDERGRRVVDIADSNLHVIGYSEPYHGWIEYQELVRHIHTLPDKPLAIPYRTAYYSPAWGFCMEHERLLRLDTTGRYYVNIDAVKKPGTLEYGEAVISGSGGSEYLLTTYPCHPSMANDNLSGVVLWALLLREMRTLELRNSYRFVIAPETIGALAYISRNEAAVRAMAGGYVIATAGGIGRHGYKRSWRENADIDRAARLAYRDMGIEYIEYLFTPSGSDERQYSSPGLRLPVGTICKDKYYTYPEYHTSLDNLDIVSGEAIASTLAVYVEAIKNLERNIAFMTAVPVGECMLGRRGLYPSIGGVSEREVSLDAIRWLLFYADGTTRLMEVAEKSGVSMSALWEAAGVLEKTQPPVIVRAAE